MGNTHVQAFTRLFRDTARYHNRFTVFRDFVEMSAIAIENAILKSDDLEQRYLAIVQRYEKDDALKMSHLLAEVVMGLESPCDFLGRVFMELELGSNHLAQYFTPYSICQLNAGLILGDTLDVLSKKPFITMSDPASGSAAMAIALADLMYEKGYNPQQQLWVSCVDLDPVAAMMAYIQLSLLHIPAEVVVGNSLSMKFTRSMRTPAHYLGRWDFKLAMSESQALLTEDAPLVVPQALAAFDKGQLSLFDMTV